MTGNWTVLKPITTKKREDDKLEKVQNQGEEPRSSVTVSAWSTTVV